MTARTKKYTKIALTLSLCLLILWGLVGTGTTLAWFADTSPVQKNVFHIGELNMAVSYRQEDGSYAEVKADTALFDDRALYEPGYVQVVYLKVENKGTVPFDYRAAISVTDYRPAVNMFGRSFDLQDYLRFGVVMADTEAQLQAALRDREDAVSAAAEELPLNTYHTATDHLPVGREAYMALIVRMPETVGNVANHYGSTPPYVELGVILHATQEGMPLS